MGYLSYVIGGCSYIPLLGVLFGLVVIVWGIIRRKEGGYKLIAVGWLCRNLFHDSVVWSPVLLSA